MQSGTTANHNQHRPTQCKPGEILELEGYSFQCYCGNVPPEDWEKDDKKMVCCGICEEIWGHLECYGFGEVYEKDKELWDEIIFVCIRCQNADPTQQPIPYSQQPTQQPTTTTRAHRARVLIGDDDNDDDDDDKTLHPPLH